MDLAQEVERPGETGRGQPESEQPAGRLERGCPGQTLAGDGVDAAGGQHRDVRHRARVEDDEQRHEHDATGVRPEVAVDPPEQLPVGVAAVVRFGIEAVHDVAHQSNLWKMRWYIGDRSSSSGWVPKSATRLPSSSSIRSARRICDSRWVITSEVRPLRTVVMAVWSSASGARAPRLVAPSRVRMRGAASD